ncbi:Protein of unknown function [Lactobacillus delbrueckii subsp. bulgaricus]|nr:Protein of unknown function [Lactobacillus delbrueckii subsp. bulgaricus]
MTTDLAIVALAQRA